MTNTQTVSADTFKDCELWELEELKRLFSHTDHQPRRLLLLMVGRISATDGLAAIEAALALKKQEIHHE